MGYFDDVEFLSGTAVPRCRVAMNRRFPDSYSLEFIRAGRMYCGIDGQRRAIIATPSVFWHHPAHRYEYGSCDDTGWDHHWILMRGERPRRMLEECLMKNFPAGFAPVSDPELFDEEFHYLLKIALDQKRQSQAEAVALLERMVAKLLPAQRKNPKEETAAFENLFAKIRMSPANAWDFKRIAVREGVSYGHFRRRFRELSGRAPHEFVLLCKMRQAAKSLLNSDAQVKAIADEAGYPDQAQFSKMFKTIMGLSPQTYRDSLPKTLS
jgi:AraC-like DNA-binding protein